MKTTPKKQSQNIKIAFSGSGYLGPAHAGFAVGMMERGFNITEVAGTSGGSIVAAIVSMGLNADQIRKIVFESYPDGIVEKSNYDLMRSVLSNSFYINDGDVLLHWLSENMGSATFQDTKIPLTIMATNLSKLETFEFSKKTTPDAQLAVACRASSSVPYIYKPVIYKGDMMVDGGVRNNIPTNKLSPGDIRVGVRIVDGGNYDVNTVVGFSKQLINCLLDANEDNLVAWAQSTGADIVEINCDPYDFLNAKISVSGKTDLFERGRKAAHGMTFNISNGNSKSNK